MKPPAIRSLLWEVFLEVSPDHNGEAKALAYRKIKALDEEEAEKFMDYAFFLGATNMPSPTINVYGNVGNLNLGTQIGLIETSLNVTSKQGLDGSDFANALKKITDDVLASKELADEHKQEVVETLAFVGQEAQAAPEQRRLSVVKPVLESIPKILSSVAALSTLWAKYGPHILHFLGL